MEIKLDEIEFITETTITIRGARRRTTVPMEIVRFFNLNDGDRIRWILFSDGKLLLYPKKVESKEGSA